MMSQSAPKIVLRAGDRFLRPLAVLGLVLGCGLALGACSKCDVPTWQPGQSGQAPHSCHSTPSPQ
jgi:hypothetical protein